jgi:hypothetical protein
MNVLATANSAVERAQDQQQPNQQQQQQQRQQPRKGQQPQKQQQAQQDKQAFAVAVSSLKLAAVMRERGKEHPLGELWLAGVVRYFRGLIGNALEIAAGLSSSASAAQQATQAAGDPAAAAAASSRVSSSSSAGPSSRPPAGASSMALLLVARCFLFASKLLGAAAAAVGEDDIKSEAAAAATVAGSDVDAAGVTTDMAAGAAADLTVETAGSARSVAVPALEDAAAEKGTESTAAGPAVSDAAAAVDSAPSCDEMLLAAQQAATISSLDSMLRDCSAKLEWLGHELQSVELPGGPGSEWGRTAARQQLLQLQGRLQQGLQDAVVRSSINSNSSSSTTTSASSSDSDSSRDGAGAGQADNGLQQIIINSADLGAALPAIAQQMVALGEALCTQFPVAHCCNNPGCVELRGASELQLVGGKGCVCGRCRCD